MNRPERWIAAIFCALCLAGCAKSPESAVEAFYKAVAKGEISEARGYVSSQLIDMLGSQKLSAALASESENIRACGGIKKIAVELQGEGEVRSGTSTITYGGDCPSKTEKLKLLKEEGKWKITVNK